jgi:hypothetical protein
MHNLFPHVYQTIGAHTFQVVTWMHKLSAEGKKTSKCRVKTRLWALASGFTEHKDLLWFFNKNIRVKKKGKNSRGKIVFGTVPSDYTTKISTGLCIILKFFFDSYVLSTSANLCLQLPSTHRRANCIWPFWIGNNRGTLIIDARGEKKWRDPQWHLCLQNQNDWVGVYHLCEGPILHSRIQGGWLLPIELNRM